jgi:protein transport protein HofC
MRSAAATLHFIELLLVLLKGNTGLVDALHILAGAGVEKPVRDSAAALLALMKKGRAFSESLRLIPDGAVFFSPLYIALIAAAELTGDIAGVLERIAADLRRKQRAKENVFTMLLYPSVIVLIALGGTVLLLVRGLPLFVAGGLLSGVMLRQAVSGIIAAGAVLLLGGAALFFAYFRIFYVDSPEFSIFYMLDFLLRSNVPLLDALAQCIASMQSGAYGNALMTIKKAIASGVPFSQAFAACKRFSPYVTGWLSVADTQGNVSVICAHIRDYYAQKDARVREIAAKLIEPAVIVLTGAYLLIIILTAIIPVLTYAGGIV